MSIKVKCPTCGYKSDIENKRCPRCNSLLLDALKCSADCKKCKHKCSIK